MSSKELRRGASPKLVTYRVNRPRTKSRQTSNAFRELNHKSSTTNRRRERPVLHFERPVTRTFHQVLVTRDPGEYRANRIFLLVGILIDLHMALLTKLPAMAGPDQIMCRIGLLAKVFINLHIAITMSLHSVVALAHPIRAA